MKSATILGIIPARYSSSRFPGKPLAEIKGKSMIQCVYEQCQLAESLDNTFVATDDERIFEHVKSWGGEVVMTSAAHQSGTERCAEAVDLIQGNHDVVLNIQGDEPLIDPAQINLLANCFSDASVEIATIASPLKNKEEFEDQNKVKVVFSAKHDALYFSRSAIPFGANSIEGFLGYKHIGLYGYRKNTLQQLVKLPLSRLEQAESLEQLRWLENDFAIRVLLSELSSPSIDTPEDLEALLKTIQ